MASCECALDLTKCIAKYSYVLFFGKLIFMTYEEKLICSCQCSVLDSVVDCFKCFHVICK